MVEGGAAVCAAVRGRHIINLRTSHTGEASIVLSVFVRVTLCVCLSADKLKDCPPQIDVTCYEYVLCCFVCFYSLCHYFFFFLTLFSW